MKQNIVITSPHAFCTDFILYRHCDRVSKYAALSLAQSFQTTNKTFRPSVHIAKRLRSENDYNRHQTRQTRYRKHLKQVFEEESNADTVLFDVHSFPFVSQNETPNVHLYFLTNPVSADENRFLFFLNEFLRKHNVPTTVLQGSIANDIVVEASEYIRYTVLIEFRESLTENEIDRINNFIVQATQNYFSSL